VKFELPVAETRILPLLEHPEDEAGVDETTIVFPEQGSVGFGEGVLLLHDVRLMTEIMLPIKKIYIKNCLILFDFNPVTDLQITWLLFILSLFFANRNKFYSYHKV
jgi:hypothetical protein